jgi:signal transduction histidine kinase
MKKSILIIFIVFLNIFSDGLAYDTAYVNKLNLKAFELRRPQVDSSYTLANEALRLSDSLNYLPGKAYALKVKGIYYWIKGDYDRANEHAYKSLRIYEELGDLDGEVRILNNISLVYLAMDNYPKTIELLEKTIFKARLDSNWLMLARAQMNLGLTYSYMKKYKMAKEKLFEGLIGFERLNLYNGVTDTYAYIGKLYMDLQMYDSSKYYLYKSLERYESKDNPRGAVMSLGFLAQCYDSLGNINETIKYASLAHGYAEKYNLKYDMHSNGRLLAENLAKQGKFREAFKYSDEGHVLADSLRNEDHARKITRLEMEYNFDKQMKEVEFKQQQKELIAEAKMNNRELWIILILIFLVSVIVIAIIISRNSRKKSQLNHLLSERNEEISWQKDELVTMNQQMEELIATKDKFFSIIAHDLKNPLGAFRDVTKYLNDQGDSISEEERNEFLLIMKNSSDNIFMLLNNLLTWARSQQGKISFIPEFADLKQIADINISLLQPAADKKKITLTSTIGNEINVHIDQNMITTVLRNLITNSIKFTREGGSVEVSAQDREDFVEVHVKDTGIGMDEKTASKLFRIDQTQSSPGTNNEEGTGLGLIICKEFIDKHKGEIKATSVIDQGSDFVFTIPKQPQK